MSCLKTKDMTFREWLLKYDCLDLLEEWDYEKNGDVTPDNIESIHQVVYWKCSEGHSWSVSPKTRAPHHSGCPYCSHKRILQGLSDLATLYPELAKQWDYERNGDLKPTDVGKSNTAFVSWIGECGHRWHASIVDRVRGAGCPYCTNKKVLNGFNDMVTINSSILDYWDSDENENINPHDCSSTSSRIVGWKCKNCGQTWKESIKVQYKNNICPYCSGNMPIKGVTDLMTKRPDISIDWDYEKNGNLSPCDVLPDSNKFVNWKCHSCGYSWRASIKTRTAGMGRGYACRNCLLKNNSDKKIRNNYHKRQHIMIDKYK